MADTIVTTAYPNFSGMLFAKGNTRTPFSTLIGGNLKTTNHTLFACSQGYDVASGSIPSISEQASLTAPDATATQRSQKYNTTQIFQETFYVSYKKESDIATLSGINIADGTVVPTDEVAFQASRQMEKIAQQVENAFINGVKAEASTVSTASQTDGIINAVTTNVLAQTGTPELSYWHIMDALKSIQEKGGSTDNLTLLVNPIQLEQLQKNVYENAIALRSAVDPTTGLNISEVVTPFGSVKCLPAKYVPAGTAVVVNASVCSPVYQPVPNKGTFFMEELAKTGAGDKYQIFGQAGLDYGAEWYHAKITGLKTTFTAPANGILTRTATAG